MVSDDHHKQRHASSPWAEGWRTVQWTWAVRTRPRKQCAFRFQLVGKFAVLSVPHVFDSCLLDITSPTFTLVSEYEGKLPLYHFDVYRLDTVEDFLNIGSEEMMYGEGVCAIEWSEKIESALPKDAIIIEIEILTPETRKITIKNWLYDKNIFSEFTK